MCDNFLRSSTEEIDLSGPLSLINVPDNIACAYQTGTARLQKKSNMLNTLPEKTQIPPEPPPPILPGHKSW